MTDLPDLSFKRTGSGLPVLIIHGWTVSSLTESHDFEPVFAKAAPGYDRIYVDLPGMGSTPADAGIIDMDSILARLFAFIDKHILPSNFLVIGSSAGAYLARAVTHRYASHIDGLLLRVPMTDPDTTKRDIEPFTPAIANAALMDSLSAQDRETLGTDIAVQTPEFVDLLRAKLETAVIPAVQAADSKVLGPIRSDPRRYGVSAPMHSPENPFLKPALVLTGRQDSVVGYRDAWPLVKCYPRASFVALDRADHALPVDETGLFEVLVLDWLRRVEELRRLAARV